MIIALSGWAQSGKDTVADRLVEEHGFVRVAFADKLKGFALRINPHVQLEDGQTYSLRQLLTLEGWDAAKRHMPVRELLQRIGMAGRVGLGETVWIDAVKEDILSAPNVVVTDVRFWNEYAWLASQGARMCRVQRDGVEAANNDVSEHEWTRLHYPVTITNNGTIEDLHKTIDELVTYFQQMRRFARFDDVP